MLLVHGNKNQRWDYTKTSKRLQALTKNHPCLEVGGWNTKDGANINIWQCASDQANQQWEIVQ